MNPSSVSVVINNYNYGCYLRQCIDSVLNQTGPADEIIMVDDGSTDNSLEILGSYADLIKVISKKNGGQASALNAGFFASEGNWILFLDADDWLKPNCIRTLKEHLNPDYTKIHFHLSCVSKATPADAFIPPKTEPLAAGAVFDTVKLTGYYSTPPTSGNLFNRAYLKTIFPIPEKEYRICADVFMLFSNLKIQNVHPIHESLGYYRIHRQNGWFRKSTLSPLIKPLRGNLVGLMRRNQILFKQLETEQNESFHNFLRKKLDHNDCKILLLSIRLSLEIDNTFPTQPSFYCDIFEKKCEAMSLKEAIQEKIKLRLINTAPIGSLAFFARAEVTIKTIRSLIKRRITFKTTPPFHD